MIYEDVETFFQEKEKLSVIEHIGIFNSIYVDIKREDLLDENVSGNKFRKLKYNILDLIKKNKNLIITVGGAHSNHIAATAAAGKYFGINTVGIIRGEELQHKTLNKTLFTAKENGMELKFVDRSIFRKIRENHIPYIQSLGLKNFEFIAEGGSNKLAFKGCEELGRQIPEKYDYIILACGTGCTLVGINSTYDKQVLGISVLKESFLENDIELMSRNYASKLNKKFAIIRDYHFGGYAKTKPQLDEFKRSFEKTYNINLDPIYTAKCAFATLDLAKNGYFKQNSKVLMIHTGGLQGNYK